jgi:hypothetical protein
MTFYSATGDFYDEKEFSKYTVNSTFENNYVIKNNDRSNRRSLKDIKNIESTESVEHFAKVDYSRVSCNNNAYTSCIASSRNCENNKCLLCTAETTPNAKGWVKCITNAYQG